MVIRVVLFVFFFKQKTAYEMRISDWSSDVCSSDLDDDGDAAGAVAFVAHLFIVGVVLAAGRTLDGPLDVVLRHVGLARGQDGATQARILVRLRQARLGRDHDFLGQPRKLLGALLILRALDRKSTRLNSSH